MSDNKHNSNQDIPKKKSFGVVGEIFDSFFIMILCFATLLTAMILKGQSSGEATYIVNFGTLALAVISFIIYLSFVLKQSDKELKETMEHRYGKKDQAAK